MKGERKNVMNLVPLAPSGMSCELDTEGHCITCSDEALEVQVLSIDEATGLALVAVEDVTEEVDITLIEHVAPGDLLLVHGGVAIAHLGEMNGEA
jgi:hydrogenase maturation factor